MTVKDLFNSALQWWITTESPNGRRSLRELFCTWSTWNDSISLTHRPAYQASHTSGAITVTVQLSQSQVEGSIFHENWGPHVTALW